MFIIDDADSILKLRHETKLMRMSNSINKTQRIIFSERLTGRIESLVDKMMVEPYLFEKRVKKRMRKKRKQNNIK
jgi:superfamily II DNA/RNA helicase